MIRARLARGEDSDGRLPASDDVGVAAADEGGEMEEAADLVIGCDALAVILDDEAGGGARAVALR